MALAEDDPRIAETIKVMQGVIAKPKLLPKYLAQPPFKLVWQVIMSVADETGYLNGGGFFTDADRDHAQVSADKTLKLEFLKKVISAVAKELGEAVDCNPAKLLAGKEPEKTNAFLQALARAAVKYKSALAAPPASAAAAPPKKTAAKKKAVDTDAAPSVEVPTTTPAKKKAAPKKKAAASKTAADDGAAAAAAPAEGGAKKKVVKKKKPAAAAAAALEEPEVPSTVAPAVAAVEESASSLLDSAQSMDAPAPTPAAPTTTRPPEPRLEPEPIEPAKPAESSPLPTTSTRTERQPQQQQDTRTLTAARAPPKVAGAMRAVEASTTKAAAPRVALVSETDHDDNDDDDMVVVTEQAPEPLAPSVSPPADPSRAGLVVREITKAMQDLDGAAQQQQQQQQGGGSKVMSVAERRRAKLEKEIATVKEQVQGICQAAHPVTTALDFFQEDLDSMEKDLEMWRNESATYRRALEAEEVATKAALQPYHIQLQEVEQQAREQEAKTTAVKVQIAENARRISQLLGMVVKSS